MKHYTAMRFVAGVLKFFGWLVVIVGVLSFIIGLNAGSNIPTSPYLNQGMVTLFSFVIAGLIILSGVFTIAAGEMISAIADVATNSWHLPSIATNSQQTVKFFEHITGASAAPRINPPFKP